METKNLYPHFSEAEFARRYVAVREAMAEADLPLLLVYGTPPFMNSEVQYLSNYPTTWEAFLTFPLTAETEPSMFVQMYNHIPTARTIARIADVGWGGPNTAEAAVENVKARGFAEGRIGLVGLIPMRHYETLTQGLPKATFVDFTWQMMQIRLVKSDEELEALRKGAEFGDRAIEALEHQARPGITEHELAAIVQGAYLGLGGRNTIHYMATTPMSNPSVCVPAQYQSTRVLEKGDVLLTELSAHYIEGYPGQILRPFTIGTPPTAEYQRMYDVAVEAFTRLASVIRAGSSSEEVLDTAEYIHSSGYTIYDDLVHSLGGGYLPPILRTRRTSARLAPPFTFKKNMTIVIQPNIITEDERMGVQVGELLRVTDSGVESLHRYPLRFIQCNG
ncbi:MAG: Xaa-Pro peptidase family protein [Ktedonobacteraceae bacterium]